MDADDAATDLGIRPQRELSVRTISYSNAIRPDDLAQRQSGHAQADIQEVGRHRRLNDSIGKFFAALGGMSYDKPFRTIFLSLLLVFACSAGFANFKVADDPNKLYAPQDSDAVKSKEFVEGAFGYQDRWGFILATHNTDRDLNVLTKASLLDFFDIYDDVVSKKSVTENGKTWHFHDMCRRAGIKGPWSDVCDVRSVLAWWDYNRTKLIDDIDIHETLNSTRTDNLGRNMDITTVLGGVQRDSSNKVIYAAALRLSWNLINNASVYQDDLPQRDLPTYACSWEADIGETYANTVVGTLRTHPSNQCYYRDVLNSSFFDDLILLVLDYILMISFASWVLARNSPVISQGTLAVGAVFCVILAMGASFGLGSAFGLEYSNTVQLLAFLLLGLGIDDAFVIAQNFRQVDSNLKPRDRVSESLRISGTAISVTSFTDMVVFLSGLGNSLPVIRALCAFGTLGVLFDWILQLTLFVGMLVLNLKREMKQKADCLCCIHPSRPENKCFPRDEAFDRNEPSRLQVFMATTYPKLLLSRVGKTIVLLFTALWLGLSIWAAPLVKADYDNDWFVPPSSDLYKAVTYTNEYFGGIQLPLDVITGNDAIVDYTTNSTQYSLRLYYDILESNEHIESCSGWNSEFLKYTNNTVVDKDDYYNQLTDFLESDIGRQFYMDIAFGNDGTIIATKALCISLAADYSGTEQVEVMDSVRETTRSFVNLGGDVYAQNFLFLDGLKVMRYEMLVSMAIAAVCVLVICIVMIGDVLVASLVFGVVVLVDVNVLAMYYFTDMTFEFLTSIILVLVVGFSVDYSAHIAHSFVNAQGTGRERATKALDSIGRSVLCGGFSTWLAVALLPISDGYFFSVVLFRSISYAVMFGLFYGLAFLPVVLSILFPKDTRLRGSSGNKVVESSFGF